jgi:hypothetical protein
VGCIGILKEWLDRALIAALREDCKTLTACHLEATALSAARCEKIAVEAREGERQLFSADQARPRLRELLGLGGIAAVPAAAPQKTPHPRRRVGQRKPKRDPIGEPAILSRTACQLGPMHVTSTQPIVFSTADGDWHAPCREPDQLHHALGRSAYGFC